MGVEGVPRLVTYRQITTTAEKMREGLRFSEARRPESDRIAEQVSPWIEEDWPTGQDTISDTPGEEPWENKIFTCLLVMISESSVPLWNFLKPSRERDAIKAHRSLFLQGNILRRNIGPKNILITDPANTNGFKGILLDLDCAKWRDSKLDEADAQLRIGTPHDALHAVEVLRWIGNTYRHDLESFFYVLLWMCGRQSWINGRDSNGEPQPCLTFSRLQSWGSGHNRSMISGKTDHMTIEGLEELMEEFPMALNVVKPLCRKIRGILFYLDQDGRMTFGTPSGDPDRLYVPIIAAFDETISTL
ncbi:hypothetical protein E4U44_001477 [Claviceps purpurea]|nr:hypothetical protein E4U44_001477 [Claviceps purpurea]